MFNKKVLLMAPVVFIASLFFLLKPENNTGGNLKDGATQKEALSSTANLSASINKSLASNLNDKQPITEEKKTELVASIASAKKWLKDRGFYYDKDLLEYQAYDDSTLLSLVKNGDLKAITVLANRMYEKGNYEDAMLLYTDGAIRGSVESLQQLSRVSHQIYARHFRDGNLEAANRFAVDMAAWDKLAKKRGYSTVLEYMQLPDIDISVSYLKTPEGMSDVERSAEIHYKMLEDERIRMGLGKFDNSVHDAWNKIKIIDSSYYDPLMEADSRRISEIYFEEN